MPAAPPIAFAVELVVPGEMRWCMRAKGAFDDWLLSDGPQRPIAELPAVDLQLDVDHCRLRLHWLELPADGAWGAIRRAATIVEDVLPELLRTRALTAEATLQSPDRAARRPPAA